MDPKLPGSPSPAVDAARTAATPDQALSEARATAAAPPPPLLVSESEVTAVMPVALKDQLTGLEKWAKANRRDSQRDAFKFWALKIPAIVVSAGSGVSAYFNLHSMAVIAGAVASLCVLIDALNPGGALRNAHLRAFNELRILQERMKSDWQVGFLRHDEDLNLLAARIIESAKKEKDRINAFLTDAEASLGVTRRGKN